MESRMFVGRLTYLSDASGGEQASSPGSKLKSDSPEFEINDSMKEDI